MKRVLLTREADDIAKSSKLFEEKGFEVLSLPLIKTQGIAFHPPQGSFEYTVFQSQKAVKYFFERATLPKDTKVVAVGRSTQKALESLGYEVCVPNEESAKGLVEFFGSVTPCNVLVPRAKEGIEDLLKFLKDKGFGVMDLAVYETKAVEYSREELLDVFSKEPILVLASPSAVKSLFANLQKNWLLYQIHLKNVICIGETTKKTYQKHFGGVCYVPKAPSMEEVVNLALTLR